MKPNFESRIDAIFRSIISLITYELQILLHRLPEEDREKFIVDIGQTVEDEVCRVAQIFSDDENSTLYKLFSEIKDLGDNGEREG